MIKSACFSDFRLTKGRAVIIIPDSDRQSGSFSFPTEAVVGGDVQRRIGSRGIPRGKADALSRYGNAGAAVYGAITAAPRRREFIRQAVIRRLSAVREAVLARTILGGAVGAGRDIGKSAVRHTVRDIGRAAVRWYTQNIGGAVPIANSPNSGAVTMTDSRAGISGECKPRGIRLHIRKRKALSHGESGGEIHGVDCKIRKAR